MREFEDFHLRDAVQRARRITFCGMMHERSNQWKA